MTPSQQQAGSVLDGKYEVLDHLGGGGMGDVYLVRHIHLQEKRVVKILRPDRVGDPDAQKRFLREARFATQIKHPHVAILYDYSRLDDGSFYMVWEYIEGEDVGTRVRRDGPFPVAVAIDLGIQALRGLQAIHGAGMIHRDVSPDNLMISTTVQGETRLKIIDLGLAKGQEPDPEHEVTQDGMFMGKLLYCAPEQAGLHKGETLDHRTDLYSMALVLYEMLTGLPPFEAETPQGAIFKRLSEDPLPLVDRNPDQPISEALERVVLRGLTRERTDRYPDAAAFIEALERVVRARGETAGGGTAPPPPTPPPDRSGRGPVTGSTAGSRELSRAEKDALLAQIEAAAARKSRGAKGGDELVKRVDSLLTSGRPDEARSIIDRLEEENPRAPILATLRERLATAEASAAEEGQSREGELRSRRKAEMETTLETVNERIEEGDPEAAREALERARTLAAEDADPETGPAELSRIEELGHQITRIQRLAERRQRIDEGAALVERYLKTKQIALARLALDTLLELAPTHPKRTDYESWIDLVGEEVEEEKRAEQVLADGREALREDQPRAARRALGQLEKLDEDLAARLREEIERAETEREQSADFDEHRERLERLIADRDLEEAQQEIKVLAELGAAKVTLDLWRARLDEARTNAVGEAQAEVFVEAFRERVEQEDYAGARSVAGELQRIAPDHPRVAELFAEVSRLEQERDRRRAVEQGEAQVRELIEAGDAGQAELALKVLLQMAPGHKQRKALEKKVAKLKRS